GVAVLGSRGAQHVGALAVEEDVGAQVDVELHVEPLGLDLADGGADAQAGVVDEHVQPSVGVPVALDDRLDRVLVGQIRRHRLDSRAAAAAAALLVCPLLAACGGSSGGKATKTSTTSSNAGPPFPAAAGRPLNQVLAGIKQGPMLAPAVGELEPGLNRFAFVLFDVSRKQLVPPDVAVYV